MPKSSGLIGIDIAYLIALFGTMAGNCIFVLGGKGPYLTQMHFFLVFDIFPALFFFLNGMTVTLTMRDKKVSNRKLLAYLGKRGAVFFIVGLIFCTKWPVNLLMASGIFFAIAPGIAKYSNVILRSAIVLLLLFAIILVNLEVPMQWEFMSPLQSLGDFKKMISFFLFNGYYSVLPWIIFFLAGLVHGRGNIRPNGFFPPSSLLGLGLVAMSFIVQQFFLGLYDNIDPIPTYGSIAFRLKLYFPAFVFFATGVCIMLLNLLTFFFSRYELPRYQKTIQNISSSKYSVYFFMMLFCFIISSGFNTVLLSQESMLILFTLGLTLLSVWVTLLWKKRLNPKAPVEWLVKYVSGSTKN